MPISTQSSPCQGSSLCGCLSFQGLPEWHLQGCCWSSPSMFVKHGLEEWSGFGKSRAQSVFRWSKWAGYSSMWDCIEAMTMKKRLHLTVTVVHGMVSCAGTPHSLLSSLWDAWTESPLLHGSEERTEGGVFSPLPSHACLGRKTLTQNGEEKEHFWYAESSRRF